jgi:SAM-dependent methyltransferase
MKNEPGITIDWAPPSAAPVRADCRNCAGQGDKPVILTAAAVLPRQGDLRVRLLDCPACGCAFVETVPSYAYGGEAADALSVAMYAEAAAGLWPIVRVLARLHLPQGARLLEIGCGFGFGLDFAIRARGWQASGVDPSPLAAAGRTQLGVPIESRFFGSLEQDRAAGAAGGADCILASEVLEHMADPRDFVAMLRRGLAPDGVLVLTTPDRARLRPHAPLAEIVPVLSVGAHLVLQTAASLHALLARAGFAAIDVQTDGGQLVAYAAAAPLALEDDEARLRHAYRAYLAARIGTVTPGLPLWWGFAGRAYTEAVADADSAEATRLWALIRPACRARFGFDPEYAAELPRLPDRARQDMRLLAARVPKALPGLLYARALERLRAGAALAGVADLMQGAADAAACLNTALLALGASDLAALAVQRAALAALAAASADAAAPDSLAALGRAIAADPDSALHLARRSFVGLVNAGAFGQAAMLRAGRDLGETGLLAEAAGEEARDVLFCLGMLALQTQGDEEPAARFFAAARRAAAPGALWWSALRGECIAEDRQGRTEQGTTLLRAAPLHDMPADLRERLGVIAA